MALTAVALAARLPSRSSIYALAIVTATLVALSRPIHAALMPEVVASPDDLTAANVVSGMAESAGSLSGPLGAGVLIGLGGPAAVFFVAAPPGTSPRPCSSSAWFGVERPCDGRERRPPACRLSPAPNLPGPREPLARVGEGAGRRPRGDPGRRRASAAWS